MRVGEQYARCRGRDAPSVAPPHTRAPVRVAMADVRVDRGENAEAYSDDDFDENAPVVTHGKGEVGRRRRAR